MKTKILKIKVGEFYDPDRKKSFPVFITAFKKESKDNKNAYYEVRIPMFVNEIELKDKEDSKEI